MFEVFGIILVYGCLTILSYLFYKEKNEKLVIFGSLSFVFSFLAFLLCAFKDWRYALLLLGVLIGLLLM
jgi:hypothetical protein